MYKYIDIHAHTNFVAFDEDRDAVIKRALRGDTWIINIGTQYDTSKKAVEMTNEYEEGVYACIGLHPIHTGKSYHDKSELGENGKEFTQLVDIGDTSTNVEVHKNASPIFTTGFTSRGEIFDKEKYKKLAKEGKVVGVGECGLDYYHMSEESIEKQKEAFVAQIELANELNLPLMLHIRNSDENLEKNAYQDTLEILKEFYNKKESIQTNSAVAEFVSSGNNSINENINSKAKGVIHFFAGTLEDAKAFIDFGFYISFAGVITYPPKKNDPRKINYEEIIKNLPLDRIMADTDSPYVAPVPYRGKRNEPSYVRAIVEKIAEIKALDVEDVARTIFSNAKELFSLEQKKR